LQVLVSLHDVTPAHTERLERAEALLTRAGVTRAAYLVVPNFHRRHPIGDGTAFHDWCIRPRSFAVDWVLHGYDHLDDPTLRHARRDPLSSLKRALLTGGEGEFLSLSAVHQRMRLAHGLAAMAAVGLETSAFVAPAWLFNDDLLASLVNAGLRYTEDHASVFDARSGRVRWCPVITWSTRAVWRRVASRIVCRSLLTLWRGTPAIRVALHPHDMDHQDTMDSVGRVLDAALTTRQCVGYADVFP